MSQSGVTIEMLVDKRKSWSDDQIIRELISIEPLPDEFKEDAEGHLINSEWDKSDRW